MQVGAYEAKTHLAALPRSPSRGDSRRFTCWRRKHGLTSHEAAYLELAVRLGLPIATLDAPLRSAAEAEGLALYAGE